MSAQIGGEILLLGPPRNLSGRIALSVPKSAVTPVSITVGEGTTVYRATIRPAGPNASELRLRLPESIPPGTYTGEASLGGKPQRIRVSIEPLLRLTIEPRQSRLVVNGERAAEFSCVVTNDGNVAFDIPQSDTLDLDDGVAQDRALGRTLRAKLSEGEHPIDHLFDELRAAHGGEATVTVRAGAGTLYPGEARQLACVLHVPGMASPGRVYQGAWQLGTTSHFIVAEIHPNERPARTPIVR